MISSFYTLLFAAGISLASPSSLSSSRSTIAPPVVSIKNGSYSGVYNPTYNQDFFFGIPYAQPPVEDLRFRVPRSLNSSWTTTKAATAYPPFCVGYGGDDTGHDLSEDCLYLNIIRPHLTTANTSFSDLPVAVWIHGGGLFMGGTNDARYNLSYIVQNSVELGTPMIGISIQYRLSGWGFLGGEEILEEGATNLGFRDQRLALWWIRENIGSFGGDKEKVTIWGESAGGQSVGAQLLAYNGRNDKLFRSAIAQSGGPAVLFFETANAGGYNSTSYQTTYTTLLNTTSCTSLSCLRTLPFSTLNTAFNSSIPGIGPFNPMIDGDFISTYPSVQLSCGNFVRVPLLIGTNTDEGTAFAPSSPLVNNNEEFLSLLNTTLSSTPSKASALSILPHLYPSIPVLGIPSLSTFPLVPGSTLTSLGLSTQYRRLTSYFGDITVNAPRRASNHAWSTFNVTSYSYRFDVTVNGIPDFIGATHFQEVAFVFDNTNGLGYVTNPFGNLSSSDQAKFNALAKRISRSWVSFIVSEDSNPNRQSLTVGEVEWPIYNASKGGGEGENIVWSVNVTGGAFVEVDVYRGEGMAFIGENALGIYGR